MTSAVVRSSRLVEPPFLAARSWRPAAVGTVRFVCLPASAVETLRFRDTAAALDRQRVEAGVVRGQVEALADELGALVPGAADQGTRRALINARRQLHQGRVPAERDVDALRVMGGGLAGRLAAVVAALRAQEAAAQALAPLLAAEYAARQEAWRAQVRDAPEFLRAMALVAPDLLPSVAAYLAAPGGGSLTQWRKLELSLSTYWSRAATKTSPLGRLTRTAAVHWAGARRTGAWQARVVGDGRTGVQLHRGVVRALFEGAASLGALRDGWRWTLHPQVERGDAAWRLRYRRRDGGGGLVRVAVPVTATLRVVAACLQGGALTLPVLAGQVEAVGGLPPGSVRSYLDRLVALRVLVPELQLTDDLPSPLGALQRALAGMALPVADALAADVQAVITGLRAFEGGRSGGERLGQVAALRSQVQALLRQVGRSGELPARLLYEDAGAEVEAVEVPGVLDPDAPEWPAVAAVAVLCAPNTLEQLDVVERFVRTFGVGGRCDEPLAFLSPEPLERALSPEDLAYLAELDRVRCRHRDAVQALLQVVRDGQGAAEVTLDAGRVTRLGEASGAPLPSRAMTLMLQPLPGGDVVVNGVLPGHGMLLSRQQVLAPDDRHAGWMRQAFESAAALYGGAPGVHLATTTDSTINAFPSPLARAARSPEDVGVRPGDVRVQDGALVHDPRRHRVTLLDGRGDPVTLLYHGAFEPAFLTPVERALCSLSPSVTSNLDLPGLLRRQEGPGAAAQAWPRVRLGRVLLARRTWMVPGEPLARGAQEPELAYWGRLRAWADERQLPLQFFGLPDAQWREEACSVADMRARPARLKPQYFDLDSFFLVRLFERWVLDAGRVWAWQEAAPHPGGSGVEVLGQVHVAELGVELHHARP